MPPRKAPKHICDEVKKFAREIMLDPTNSTQLKRKFAERMLELYGQDGSDLAFNILAIGLARSNTTSIGTVNMDLRKNAGNDINEINVTAESITGSNIGVGNMVEIEFNQFVDKSSFKDDRLPTVLKDSRKAIVDAKIDDDVKADILASFEKLAAELGKSNPKEGKLKVAWNAISGFFANVRPFIELGTILFQTYNVQ
jgi:hypothetical protein